MKPVCSIIIRAYNEEKHIGKLLEGIFHQSLDRIQVILVDSGSTDATVEIASQFPVEIIHIQPQDFTFGRSINMGVSAADADYVVFASAHVYPVYPDWLERLLEPFDDDLVALAYGKQRGNENSKFSEQMIFSHWFPEETNLNQDHPFNNNANAAIRRSCWLQRPYDEKLPGLEDLDWARWAIEQGFRIAYVAEAEIVHVHQETWQGIRNRYQRESMAFKMIYPQERFNGFDFIHALLTNISADLRMAARRHVLPKELGKIVAFRWNQFVGTYRGYNQIGPLTWKLRQTFYYPRMNGRESIEERSVAPITYQDSAKKGQSL